MSEVGSPTSAATTSSTALPSTSSTTDSHFAPSTLALQVGNIKSFIPIVLDLQVPNYSQWCHLFLVHLGRYSLRRHVDGSEPAHDDPAWVQEDFIVLQWLYTTISAELFQMVMQPNSTAYGTWRSLEGLFVITNLHERFISRLNCVAPSKAI